MEEEKELVEKARIGDKDAFMELYNRYFHSVFTFVYFKVGNQQIAEDITQDTFLKAMKSIRNFEGKSKFRSWLTQIAKFTVMDYYRKKYRYTTVELEDYLASTPFSADLDGEEAEREAISMEKENMARTVLEKLPENYRKVLEYRFLESLSLKETAVRLETTPGNVKVLQFRALKKLQDMCDKGEIHY